jgi:hypothetical protein
MEMLLMDGTIGLTLAMALSFVCVLIHYEALGVVSVIATDTPLTARLKMLAVISGVIVAHMIEAGVFAIGFWVGAERLHIGRFVGAAPVNAFQFYYFALETYTTQSVGDLYPVGGLRVLASLEPLVGLILIGWSTSFTFLVMRRYWRLKPTLRPAATPPRPQRVDLKV